MNQYEYDGETVMAIGLNDNKYFVETESGTTIVNPDSKLEAGMMLISVEEVCSIYNIDFNGQTVYGPRRRS